LINIRLNVVVKTYIGWYNVFIMHRLLRELSLLILACAILVMGGCSYSFTYVNDSHIDECGVDVIMDAASDAFYLKDYDEAAHLAAYVSETWPSSPETEEALFIGGESQFFMVEYWEAFECYRKLLARFPASPHIEAVAEREYLVGEALINPEPGFFGHIFNQRSRGVKVLNHLITRFSQGDRADDAQVAIADYYYSSEKFEDCTFYYTELIREYPRSEWVEKSVYRLGISYFNQSRGPSYDRECLLKARTAFGYYISKYSDGGYAEEVAKRILEIDNLLAEKEFEIAQFYLQQDQTFGARIHLANAVILFPTTRAGIEAQKILNEKTWDTTIHSVDRFGDEESLRFITGR